jgi:hypothetical protein
MIGLFSLFLALVAAPFKSKSRLEAENAVLRHQLIGLRRKVRGRVRLTNNDRWFLIQLYRWFPSILNVLTIIQPETLLRWHRAGFRCYWRWKSRPRGGRPLIETDLHALIRKMSVENPLWGAPRIHGGLLNRPPSQGGRSFLRNHAPDEPVRCPAEAADCLAKDRDTLLAFYDSPAEHWKHLRTTNPIALSPPCATAPSDRRAACRTGPRSRWSSNWSRARRKAGAVSTVITSCQNSFSV